MRSLGRISLGLLGLAAIAPAGVVAQTPTSSSVPSGYQATASPSTGTVPTNYMVGLDGRNVAPPAADAATATVKAPAPHKHKPRVVCPSCAAKIQAQAQASSGMPPGKIVSCEHQKSGVCAACQAVLAQPGPFVMAGGQASKAMVAGQPAEAPGRAVASSSPGPAATSGRVGAYDPGMAEPAPIGVVQANFSQGGPMPAAPAGMPSQAMAPGRAMVESPGGRDPYQAKSGPFPKPHILGHLFGWSGIGAERAEERARRKSETHAMISYEEGAPAPVEELPASMVFGKKGR